MRGKIQEKQENERVSGQLDLPAWMILLKKAIEDCQNKKLQENHDERRKLASDKR